jgi:hypothetical protein
MPGTIRTMVGILTLALLGGVVLAPSAAAFTSLDAAYGTPFDAATAKSAAMGSVGVSLFQGSASLIQNPALLGSFQDRALVDLTGGLLQADEDRFEPLFDSFESYVTEMAYASNRNSYGSLQGGALFRLSPERSMTVGVGVYERYLFDYEYFEEVRDPEGRTNQVPGGVRDQVIQTRDYSLDGRLRSLSFGYGMELMPQRLSVGLSLHRWFGTVDHVANMVTMENYETIYQNPPSSAAFEQELSGWSWTLGAQGRITPHVEAGVSYEGEYTLDGALTTADTTGTLGMWVPYDQEQRMAVDSGGDVEVRYPGTLAVGVALRPRNRLETVFSFDLVRRFWTGVDQESYRAQVLTAQGELRDTWDLRLGLEHVFPNGMPARFGFRYLENYADRESARSIFSGGVGFPAGGFVFDVTVQYHRQTSRQAFLIERTLVIEGRGDSPYNEPQGLSKVEDGLVGVLVGVSRSF